ncbi:hypothetical protein MBANPS3_010437 [Mucor bainieri]
MTQSTMTEVIKLIHDVTEAKKEYPNAKVPAADLIFNYNDPRRTHNQNPALRQTTHTVHIVKKNTDGDQVETARTFTMNPPSEIIKLFVANPSLSSHLAKLPDDTPNELLDSYQSNKWRTHELFQHPMVAIPLNRALKDVWVGDVVKTANTMLVVDRFFTLNQNKLMIAGFEVEQLPAQHNHFGLKDATQTIVVNAEDLATVVYDDPTSASWYLPESDQAETREQCASVVKKLLTPNLLKRATSMNPSGKFMPVKVVPLNMFSDDMSGNRTKKFNKFDSCIMVPAALPLVDRNALENTAFIFTDHFLSAMHMLPAIVDNLLELENGVEMALPSGEPVLVVAPLQFITGDNARHAELASSRGATSLRPCRKCNWKQETPGQEDGSDYQCSPRSEEVVEKMYQEFLSTGSAAKLKDVQGGYELKGGQALLKLRALDTMKDLPIELLHTIMLGVGKELVRCLPREQDFLQPVEKSLLETKLFGHSFGGFSRCLRSFLRLHRSFLGRDYKVVMQQLPIVLSTLIASGEIVDRSGGLTLIVQCLTQLGQLTSLCYTSKITNLQVYTESITCVYNNFRRSVLAHDKHLKGRFPTRRNVAQIYSISKMHILCHLAEEITRHGAPTLYETEKGEQFNKFIREALFRTNRRNPSRDTATAFGKRLITRHILSGGSWTAAGRRTAASHKALQTAASFDSSLRDFDDSDDRKLSLKQERYGSYFIGEVTRINAAAGTFTVAEYALCNQQDQTAIKRFKISKNGVDNLFNICQRNLANHLVVTKLGTTITANEDRCKFVEMLDISVNNLLNVHKFGSFWWTLTHLKGDENN